MGGKFKFQAQDNDLEYLFLEIWQTHRTLVELVDEREYQKV